MHDPTNMSRLLINFKPLFLHGQQMQLALNITKTDLPKSPKKEVPAKKIQIRETMKKYLLKTSDMMVQNRS